MEGIYLIHTREFITTDIPIYKIGRSYNIENRTNQYPRGSKVLCMIMCENSLACENYLINLFKTKFIQKTYYGREYFEGDKNLMIREIFNYIDNIYNINNLDVTNINNNLDVTDIVNNSNTNTNIINNTNVINIIDNLDVTDIVDIYNSNITININSFGCENIAHIDLNKFKSLFDNDNLLYNLSNLLYKNRSNINFTKDNINIVTYLDNDMEIKNMNEDEFITKFKNNIKNLYIELFYIHKNDISHDDLVKYMQIFLLSFETLDE